MNLEFVNEQLTRLKSEINKLDFESKTARLTIAEHCSNVRHKIDLQAEILIEQINQTRCKYIAQADKYHDEKLRGLEKTNFKSELEKNYRRNSTLFRFISKFI